MKVKEHFFELVLFSLLGIQFLMVIYINLVKGPVSIDCDSAKVFVHAVEMWRNKKIVIPDWKYITTMELDCSLLLAVPLFGLTKNIYLAFGLSNIIFLMLFIWLIFQLFKGKTLLCPLLGANFICIPYNIGQLDYFNMMFFNASQYIIKVILPILLIAILIHKGQKALYIIYGIFLIICSFSSALYVFACGLFPVFAGYFIWLIINEKGREDFISFFNVGCLTVVGTVFGLVLNRIYGIGTHGMDMRLCMIHELPQNLSSCFFGIFELFGATAYTEIKVLSYNGIVLLCHIMFVLLILGGGVLLSCEFITAEVDRHQFFCCPYLSGIILY